MKGFKSRDVTSLGHQIRGEVFTRGTHGYRREVSGFNLLTASSPDLVVVPEDEADVQAILRWAAEHDCTVHPQATGHGAYRPLEAGMLLKTTRLNRLAIDQEAQRFTVGAGLTWQDVVPELHAAGLMAVSGSAATVSVVGLLLGGGIGPLSRTLGVASDYAESFRVVNAAGEVLVADAEHHPDLFWALRGGKVGLGVVTEATVRAVPLSHVYGGGLFFGAEDMDRLAHAWLDWVTDLPDAVNSSIAFLRLPPEAPGPLGGATVLHLRFAYVDIEASHDELRDQGEAYLAPLRALGTPIIDTIGLLPGDRLAEIHADPTDPVPVWEWGDMLESADHDLIEHLVGQVGGKAQSVLTAVELRRLGGALVRDDLSPSAVGGTRAAFSLLVLGVAIKPVAPLVAVETAGHMIRDLVQPWSASEINYHWAGYPTPEVFINRLWPAETAERLSEVRSRYDPNRLFEFGN
ncbi:FAD-binding oxidoreductase [Nesterenkonia muleiensis]|uniref:FAD-binding oxidoreductase n=1 Tax=Nesterenkonia muleiensis TaxID=2282648 RepID=UPI000E725A0F|nr:FAD-binding oxidoreductase [Nesterenkonia muleiensis]